MLSQKLQSLSKSLQRDFPDHKGEVARYMHTLITEAKQLEQQPKNAISRLQSPSGDAEPKNAISRLQSPSGDAEPKNAIRERRIQPPPIAHPERLVYGRSVHYLTPNKRRPS